MKMAAADNVYAVILAGGNGERFWPVSTPERPKQFVDLFEGKTLIRHAYDRIAGMIPPERTLVVTAARFVARTRRELPELPRANVIGEPCRRDTAAAMALAAAAVARLGGEDAIACVLTADQLMKPVSEFRRTLGVAIAAAGKSPSIVTIGIAPTRPATGYGYIECAERPAAGSRGEALAVTRFVEKPDVAKARRYLKSGRFLWNSGMFVWRVSTVLAAFAECAPDFLRLIGAVRSSGSVAAAMRREYEGLRTISFDFAVMERVGGVLVVPGSFEWDDVGSWPALANHFPADADGNVALGRAVLRDVRGSIVVSGEGHLTAVMGLDNVVVVHTPKATLVCARDRVPELRKLLAK